MNNRFKELFDLFWSELKPFADLDVETTRMAIRFSFDYKEGVCEFAIFENNPEESTFSGDKFSLGGTLIKPASELVYHSRVWFFSDSQNNGELEAYVSYLDDYRPKVVVHLDKPKLVLRNIKTIPYIPGITPSKPYSEPLPISQPSLF